MLSSLDADSVPRRAASGPPIDLNSTQEQRAEFRRRIQERDEEELTFVAALLDADIAERAIWERIARSYQEAFWILQVQQFPNGRPLAAQFSVDLELWMLAMGAIKEYANRGIRHQLRDTDTGDR